MTARAFSVLFNQFQEGPEADPADVPVSTVLMHCHCFGSQRLTVVLPLPSLTLICCGIRARGRAPLRFISASTGIVMSDGATHPSVPLLDSGRHRPSSVKVQSALHLLFFSLHFHFLNWVTGRVGSRDLVWTSSCSWIHWAGVERQFHAWQHRTLFLQRGLLLQKGT